MKTGRYKNIDIQMTRGFGYGQYYIHANYNDVDIKVHTTSSDAWDWISDNSNEEKHLDALEYCYKQIVSKYMQIT